MLSGAVILLGFSMAAVAVSYLRPGWIARYSPEGWIWTLGVAMPLAVLTLLVAAALLQGEALLPKGQGAATVRIEVTARQWAWEFTYPEAAGRPVTETILHLPAGVPVDLVVTGTDVIHSFWIPRLGGKIDAIPGRRNVVRLLAEKPGRYEGVCAEYCGAGHTHMRFVAEAHDAAGFDQILQASR